MSRGRIRDISSIIRRGGRGGGGGKKPCPAGSSCRFQVRKEPSKKALLFILSTTSSLTHPFPFPQLTHSMNINIRSNSIMHQSKRTKVKRKEEQDKVVEELLAGEHCVLPS